MESIDYGYPWWLSYGHLPILIGGLAILFIAYRLQWPRWIMVFAGIIAIWAGTAFSIARFMIDVNGRPQLPTERFLVTGTGRVLDVGAGTGRSSIMVLQARPQATLVSSDLFEESFDQHFGRGGTPQDRLASNLKAAGVDHRATIAKADMRKLPFGPAEFDAVVSAYAMDHVSRADSDRAIEEVARVLKGNGQFLLMVVAQEPWAEFAFGPLLKHGGARHSDWWVSHVQKAGFEKVEDGTRPLTYYLLTRRL